MISRHYAKFRDTCAAVINEGLQAGVFKEVEPNIFASFVLSVIDGVSLQWLFDETVFEYDEMVASAKEMILNSLIKK